MTFIIFFAKVAISKKLNLFDWFKLNNHAVGEIILTTLRILWTLIVNFN